MVRIFAGSYEEFFALLAEGQPWTPREIDDILWDRYGVTYDRAHLARILRADGMQYAKPRPMDPRQSPDTEADFRERLGEALTKDTGDGPLVLGFFDASWPNRSRTPSVCGRPTEPWKPTNHRSQFRGRRADELGIGFVFLPPYSPTFDAIEPVWKSLKRKISPEIFEDKDHFKQFVTDTFLDLSKRLGFAYSWIETFLPDVQKLR